MGKIPNTEQWLLDGKCKECRKNNYCSKPCKKHIQQRDYLLRSAATRAIFRAITRK